MKISEIFYTVQGEVDVGKPAVFIRFSGCNLINEGKGCKFCDSLYAEQGKEMSVDEIINEAKKYNCKNIIISGGESFYQLEGLRLLVEKLYELKYNLDIETNGTLFDLDILWFFDNKNCSPKKQAINIEVLKKINKFFTRFKFVFEDKNDLWWEKVIEEVGIEKENVWIMCEGKTRGEQLNKMLEVVEYCEKKGFNFTPRLHTLIWDNQRGV